MIEDPNFIVELFVRTLSIKHKLTFEKDKEEYIFNHLGILGFSSTPTSMDKEILINLKITSLRVLMIRGRLIRLQNRWFSGRRRRQKWELHSQKKSINKLRKQKWKKTALKSTTNRKNTLIMKASKKLKRERIILKKGISPSLSKRMKQKTRVTFQKPR